MNKLSLLKALALCSMLSVVSNAGASYRDVNPQTYYDYFVHLTDDEIVFNPQYGDISLEDAYRDVLPRPNRACGMRFEDVRSDWRINNGPYRGGPNAGIVIVHLPGRGCRYNSVKIQVDGRIISTPSNATEFVPQSYITYWVDRNGRGFGGCNGGCSGSGTIIFGRQSTQSEVELELGKADLALQQGQLLKAKDAASAALAGISTLTVGVNNAIQLRRMSDLGEEEDNIRVAEDLALADLSNAKLALELCHAASDENDVTAAQSACDKSKRLLSEAQGLLSSVQRVMQEDTH
ncbi:MAG: hypothetical protein MI750_03860 [Xanthomonadales bacterium]|nr:hypothetical protein [Xanthomonadales bacterium]